MSVYAGNNLFEWVQHFQFSEDCHAFLMFLGAASCADLQFIYDDVRVLEDLEKNISVIDYKKFLEVKSLTSVLSSQTTVTPPPPANNTSIQPPAPPAVSITDPSIDVKNSTNSVSRWANALNIYQQESTEARNNRTPEKIVINALIDISGSMEGKKLIAVKLGLCALISHLQDNDVMNITTFSDRNRTITNGFQLVRDLKINFPQLLANIRDDGSTAFFDAVIDGIRHLRSYTRQPSVLPPNSTLEQQDVAKKAIVIALTDGEDNSSRHSSAMVFYRLTNPGINHFMFILVAVDMRQIEEDSFKSWMELRHCKQMSVNIHTGSKLVSIFREVLVHRVLLTDVNHTRFYQTLPDLSDNVTGELAGVASISSAPFIDLDAEDAELIRTFGATQTANQSFPVLRQGLLRQHNALNGGSAGNDVDDEDGYECYSPAISRCNSVSDFGNNSNSHIRSRRQFDCDSDTNSSDNDDDDRNSYLPSPPSYYTPNYPNYNPSSPIYAPNSPAYGPASPAYSPATIPFFQTTIATLPTFTSSSPLLRSSPLMLIPATDDINRPSQIRRLSASPSTLLVQQQSVDPLAGGMRRVLIVDEIDNEGRLFRPSDTIPTVHEELELEEEELLNLPKDCYCPITHKVMIDPMICADGHTYERRAIEEWFRQGHDTSPLTNLPLPSLMLLPNHSLKNLITTLKVSALEETKKKQSEDGK
eukprot:CAMPEP_0173153116 /NCGR_PEP_ID=MMETSP1105-20130129/12655_1 /TAXON_ID=2985 /ORGANISM="Ochromonas sp., Strain BG-1" /LENGTH=701 /DNA_ID=CAMNT_0014068963 /DNA_START=83 /DNA_END=2188 /DNA_ORIENTATION=-